VGRAADLAAALRRELESDAFGPVGTRLPVQRELVARYGVPDRVLTRALNELAREGYVRIKPRQGVWRTDPAAPRTRLELGTVVARDEQGYLFNPHMSYAPPVQAPTRGVVECPQDVARLLGVQSNTAVFARHRAVGPAGVADQITVTYFPLDLVRELPVLGQPDTGPGGWLERLELEHLGAPTAWPAEVLTRLPAPGEARLLDMPEDQPVLVELRAYVHQDRVLAVDEVVRDGRRWSLGYTLQRDESATWPYVPAVERNPPEG
jgi:GntR family transcriptional regulator